MTARPGGGRSVFAWFRDLLRDLFRALPVTFRGERLPSAPPAAGPGRESWWRWLTASEALPELPPVPQRPSLLAAVFQREQLPIPDPDSAHSPSRELSLFRWLMAREPLGGPGPDSDPSSGDA